MFFSSHFSSIFYSCSCVDCFGDVARYGCGFRDLIKYNLSQLNIMTQLALNGDKLNSLQSLQGLPKVFQWFNFFMFVYNTCETKYFDFKI